MGFAISISAKPRRAWKLSRVLSSQPRCSRRMENAWRSRASTCGPPTSRPNRDPMMRSGSWTCRRARPSPSSCPSPRTRARNTAGTSPGVRTGQRGAVFPGQPTPLRSRLHRWNRRDPLGEVERRFGTPCFDWRDPPRSRHASEHRTLRGHGVPAPRCRGSVPPTRPCPWLRKDARGRQVRSLQRGGTGRQRRASTTTVL